MKTPVSAQEVANYFIEIASKIDENDLTNLKLQKLLYFAQGKYLAEKGKLLFDDPIEAWKLGPVVRNVYDNFKYCGPYPITAFDKSVKRPSLPEDLKEFLTKIWETYGKYSGSYLVDKTHEEGSPWKETYSSGENEKISAKLMYDFFKTHPSY